MTKIQQFKMEKMDGIIPLFILLIDQLLLNGFIHSIWSNALNQKLVLLLPFPYSVFKPWEYYPEFYVLRNMFYLIIIGILSQFLKRIYTLIKEKMV